MVPTTGANGQLARIYALEQRQTVQEAHVRELNKDVSSIATNVAVIKRDIDSIAESVRLFEAEVERREEQDRLTTRWRIGTALALISAILVAAGIVASALP